MSVYKTLLNPAAPRSCRCHPVEDVGITFRERVAGAVQPSYLPSGCPNLLVGESKLTMKQNFQYLQQLGLLYWDRYAPLIVLLGLLALYLLYQLVGLVL